MDIGFQGIVTNLTQEEVNFLQQEMEKIVMGGTISEEIRPVYEKWRIAMGLDDRQALLCMSTVFPQRIMISLLRYKSN